MKSLLFIGGTGFIGQSFFDYLNKGKLKNLQLSKIIIISRRNKKIRSKIKIFYIKRNITSIKKIPITDYIIYAANSDNSSENIKGYYNFKKLLGYEHKKTKILFTSSGAVYGPTKIKKKLNEKSLISFNKVSKFSGYKKKYAKSKIIIEREFKKLGAKGFNVSIARLFSFVGKRILINKNFAITNLINQAKNKKNNEILLKDTNDVYRGYMHSDDLVRWLVKIMLKSDKNCNIYNVGSDEAITIKKLANIIAKKFNKKVSFNNKNILKITKKNVDYYVPSIKKVNRFLNLKINKKIENSINEIIKI